MPNLEGYSNQAALIGRIFYASLFILYGYMKLTGFAGATAYMAKMGLPAPAVSAAVAVIFELGGGLLVLVGYQTRLVGLLLAIYTFIAALIAHAHFGDPAQLTHFMKNMAIVGGGLFLAASGAGVYSLDARKG